MSGTRSCDRWLNVPYKAWNKWSEVPPSRVQRRSFTQAILVGLLDLKFMPDKLIMPQIIPYALLVC